MRRHLNSLKSIRLKVSFRIHNGKAKYMTN